MHPIDAPPPESPSAARLLASRVQDLVRAQPAPFGLAVCVLVYLLVTLPGLNRFGLWDPWEMDRVNVAGKLLEPPRVLVVEPAGPSGGGPLERWLSAQYGARLIVVGPESQHSGAVAKSATRELERATARLDEEVFHHVVVDASAAVSDPTQPDAVEELVVWLEQVRAKSPGTRVSLVVREPPEPSSALDAAATRAALTETYALVRADLAFRELTGKTWGRPGDFRRAFAKQLSDAQAAGYSPLGLPPVRGTASFLETGFWKAAERNRLDTRFSPSVPPAVVEAVRADPLFSLPAEVIAIPGGAALDEAISAARAGEGATTDGLRALGARLQDTAPWMQVQLKRDGQSWSVAPLGAWLEAASITLLGRTEAACRFPGVLLGLLGLLAIFRFARRVWGPGVATLSGLVLATLPLYFGQARSAAGDMPFVLALILSMTGLGHLAHAGRLEARALLSLAAGVLLALFAQGLFGLLVVAVSATAVVLVTRDLRLPVLVPVMGLALLTGLAWFALGVGHGPGDPYGFASHFGLDHPPMGWKLPFADRKVWLNFDVLVRQIGFGAAPWSILLPMALAALVLSLRDVDGDPARRFGTAAVLVWFIVPYAVQSIVLKTTNVFVFPAIPAAAVALGVLLYDIRRGRALGVPLGFAAMLVGFVLISNAGKTPEPLTAFLTVDPPLAGEKGEVYPEALKLPFAVKLAFWAVSLLVLAAVTRLPTRLARVARFFARPRPFWLTSVLLLAAFVVLILSSLESQIAQSFATATGQMLEPIHRVFVRSVFYWRPEVWALLAVAVMAEVAVLVHHTRLLAFLRGFLTRWVLTRFVACTLALLGGFGALGAALGLQPDAGAALSAHGLTLGILLGLGVVGGLGVGFALRESRRVGGLVAGAVAGLATACPLGAHLVASSLHGASPLIDLLGALALALIGFPLGARVARYPAVRALVLLAASAVAAGLLVAVGPGGVHLDYLALPVAMALTVAVRGFDVLAAARRLVTRAWGSVVPFERGSPVHAVVTTTVGLLLALSALALTLSWGTFPDGFVAFATFTSPAFFAGLLGLALVVGLALVARREQASGETRLFTDDSLLRPLRGLGTLDARIALGALPLAIGGVTVLALVAQLLKESGLSIAEVMASPDPQSPAAQAARTRGLVIGGLVVASALTAIDATWHLLRRHLRLAHVVGLGAAALLGLVMAVPLVRKWLQLQPAVEAPGSEPFLPYLLTGSRRTQLLVLALVALGALYGATHLRALATRVRAQRPTRELLSIVGLGLVGLVGALVLGLVPNGAGAAGGLILAGLGVAIWLNHEPTLVTRAVDGLRTFRGGVAAASALLALGVAARIDGLGLAVALVPPLLSGLILVLRPSSPAAPSAAFGAVFVRGILDVVAGALPGLFAAGLALAVLPAATHEVSLPLFLHVTAAVGALTVAWFLIVAFRVGLGIADLLPSLALRPATVALLGGFATVDAYRILRVSGSASTPLELALAAVTVMGLGGLLLTTLRLAPWHLLERLERPRVFVPFLTVAVLAFALVYEHKLVKALSFHVSQKHLLETITVAEGGTLPDGRVFQHGLGTRSTANFYLGAIPEVKEQAAALGALTGKTDELLTLTVPGRGGTTARVLRGFSPKNDANGDGARDFPADAGVLTAASAAADADLWVEDATRSWTPDAWAGAQLIDADGFAFTVLGNTATRLRLDASSVKPPARTPGLARPEDHKAPSFDPWSPARARYTLDAPNAPEHAATAMARQRVYFLLPKIGNHAPAYTDRGSFSELNYEFRKKNGGQHLVVLDDRSSRILLVTSDLLDGETDKNWLRQATLTDDAFVALAKAGGVKNLALDKPLDGILNWNDTMLLLGFSMEEYAVSRGKNFKLRLYFKSIKAESTAFKIFIHIDRAGNRIGGDHWPNSLSQAEEGKNCVGCFESTHWLPGDIVIDSYEHEVPLGTPTGEQEIWLGLYNPSNEKRAKIVSWNDAHVRYGGSDDRARIGTFVVR